MYIALILANRWDTGKYSQCNKFVSSIEASYTDSKYYLLTGAIRHINVQQPLFMLRQQQFSFYKHQRKLSQSLNRKVRHPKNAFFFNILEIIMEINTHKNTVQPCYQKQFLTLVFMTGTWRSTSGRKIACVKPGVHFQINLKVRHCNQIETMNPTMSIFVVRYYPSMHRVMALLF